jgi:hypothetical protein
MGRAARDPSADAKHALSADAYSISRTSRSKAVIAQRPHQIVVDRHARGGNRERPITLLERFRGQRLDAQPGSLRNDLHFTCSQAKMVAKCFRNHQPPCLINRCLHA